MPKESKIIKLRENLPQIDERHCRISSSYLLLCNLVAKQNKQTKPNINKTVTTNENSDIYCAH